MAAPTHEERKKWRDRWKKYPEVKSQILKALKGDNPPESEEDGASRQQAVMNILDTLRQDKDFDLFKKQSVQILTKPQYPVLDLRGIGWFGEDLNGVSLKYARLEWSFLQGTNFEKADFENAHLEGADLYGVNLNYANMHGTHLHGANLSGSKIVGADFTFSKVGKLLPTGLYHACQKEDGYVAESNYAPTTAFNVSKYLPKWRISRPKQSWRLMTDRWFYTNFHNVSIENADTAEAANFRRYIEDQRFVRVVRKNHPFIYHLWNWITACGWSAGRVTLFALFLMTGFSWIYANCPLQTFNCLGLVSLPFLPIIYFLNFDWWMTNPTPNFDPQKAKSFDKTIYSLYKIIYKWWLDVLPITDQFRSGITRRSLIYWTFIFPIPFLLIFIRFPRQWDLWMYSTACKIPIVKQLTVGLSLIPGESLFNTELTPGIANWLQWFYISFDIFTNLGIRIQTQPACNAAIVLMFLETIAGWTALGLLLTVFANKIARRA